MYRIQVDCQTGIKEIINLTDDEIQQMQASASDLPTAEQNKNEAKLKLAGTDWVNQPDVINPNVNPHLLNQSEFITYRAALRVIAINPQAGNIDWPVKPQEQWS